MTAKERLYDSFGELLYALCQVDGAIQEAEKNKLENLLKKHSYGQKIWWSFNYEEARATTVDIAYDKALEACKFYGPNPDYPDLFIMLNEIAAASNSISTEEEQLINNFEKALKQHFIEQYERKYPRR